MTAVTIPEATRPWAGVVTWARAERAQALFRLGTVILAVVVAFHYSLLTLLRSLGLATPLAYLGLVPFIALGIAALRLRPSDSDPGLHDRTIDYIIGTPLLVASLLALFVLPVQRSTTFWPYRLDILALPLFAAGAISLLLGVRMLGRLKPAVAFLLLAWPWPYKALLSSAMDGFTNATISGLRWAVQYVPAATHIPGGDGSRFEVVHRGMPFNLSVAAACAGVNGIIGFFIVGTAFLVLVKGRRLNKLIWLAAGLGLIWLTNVGRILLIFAIGKNWGESVAIDGFHPFIGLVTFSLGVLAMIGMLRLFRLRIPVESRRRATALGDSLQRAVPRPLPAIAVVMVFALLLGLANNELKANELTASDLGDPVLASFSEEPTQLEGWTSYKSDEYTHGRQFFGDDSTWLRYNYTDTSGGYVIADVINTSNLRAFEDYTVENCYGFHKYQILDSETVNLGGGVVGQVITYRDPKIDDGWTTLNWIWPVKDGNGTRFERIILFTKGGAGAAAGGATLAPVRELGTSIDNVLRQNPDDGDLGPEVAAAEDFLVELGGSIVRNHAAQSVAA